MSFRYNGIRRVYRAEAREGISRKDAWYEAVLLQETSPANLLEVASGNAWCQR